MLTWTRFLLLLTLVAATNALLCPPVFKICTLKKQVFDSLLNGNSSIFSYLHPGSTSSTTAVPSTTPAIPSTTTTVSSTTAVATSTALATSAAPTTAAMPPPPPVPPADG